MPQSTKTLTLPEAYSAMECRLAFDWLQSLAQRPDAPPFAAVALAAWHALASAAAQDSPATEHRLASLEVRVQSLGKQLQHLQQRMPPSGY